MRKSLLILSCFLTGLPLQGTTHGEPVTCAPIMAEFGTLIGVAKFQPDMRQRAIDTGKNFTIKISEGDFALARGLAILKILPANDVRSVFNAFQAARLPMQGALLARLRHLAVLPDSAQSQRQMQKFLTLVPQIGRLYLPGNRTGTEGVGVAYLDWHSAELRLQETLRILNRRGYVSTPLRTTDQALALFFGKSVPGFSADEAKVLWSFLSPTQLAQSPDVRDAKSYQATILEWLRTSTAVNQIEGKLTPIENFGG